MYLKEQYTESEAQELFLDMIDQFSYYMEDLDFWPDDINKTLQWLSKNNRKTLGKCVYKQGRFFIYLNPNILNFEYDGNKIIKEVLAHELCHTLPGCLNHGKEFHDKARLIKNLMGYNIDTKADVDSSEYFRKYLPNPNYKLICNKCGKEIAKSNMSDFIKNPGKYSHTNCGGKFSSYKLNKSTGGYELYKSSEDKIDYDYKLVCPDCDWSTAWKTKQKDFLSYINYLNKGDNLYCPKCGKFNVYALDKGKEIHPKEI